MAAKKAEGGQAGQVGQGAELKVPETWEEMRDVFLAFRSQFNEWAAGMDKGLAACEARLGMMAPNEAYDVMKMREELTQVIGRVNGLAKTGGAVAAGAAPVSTVQVNQILHHPRLGWWHAKTAEQKAQALKEGWFESIEAAAKAACGEQHSAKQLEAKMKEIHVRTEVTDDEKLADVEPAPSVRVTKTQAAA